MKFKKIAIIGKYPAAIESNEMDSQLIDLIQHLSKKDYELIIEEKTQKKNKNYPLSSNTVTKYWC